MLLDKTLESNTKETLTEEMQEIRSKEKQEEANSKELTLGRICEVQRDSFHILFDNKQVLAVLKGKFYKNNLDFPVVGDFVRFRYNPQGHCIIEEVCERKSILKRPDQSGHAIGFVKTMMEQVMVANFDYVFIVVSLNDNFNLNRIARYVSLTIQGNGIPVVILTKADLCEDTNTYVEEVKALSEKVKVHAICSLSGEGMEQLNDYVKPNVTIALLGSSGVGKSTLVNALAEEEIMKTGEIRERDSKGRHTTTSRELMELKQGVTIIDTPGMRELGMCDVEEGIQTTFSDIQEWMTQCRFGNCTHTSEPGCAISVALNNGELDKKRWELYQSLQKESRKSARMKLPSQKRRKY